MPRPQNSLSALRARKSAISSLPKMALGAISTPSGATIDEIRAVRAGRQEVLAPAVIGGMSRSRFLKVDTFSGSGSINVSNVQASCPTAFAHSPKQRSSGFADPLHYTRDTPLTRRPAIPHLENKWL